MFSGLLRPVLTADVYKDKYVQDKVFWLASGKVLMSDYQGSFIV